MIYPITEHTVENERHRTFYLAAGVAGRAADRLRARLAGAVNQLAAPAAVLRRSRLPRRRARHAGLRPIRRVPAPRGLRAPAHRARHDRLARRAGARQGHLGRSRLGQPGGLGAGQPSPRALLRRGEPVRTVFREGLRARDHAAPDRPLRLSGSGVSSRTMGLSALLRGELRQGERSVRGQRREHREGAVQEGQSARQGQAVAHGGRAPRRRLVRRRRPGARPADGHRPADPERLRDSTSPLSSRTASSGRIPGT